MRIRVKTCAGETVFDMDVLDVVAHFGPRVELRAGQVLCVEAVANGGSQVRAVPVIADAAGALEALRLCEFQAVPEAPVPEFLRKKTPA